MIYTTVEPRALMAQKTKTVVQGAGRWVGRLARRKTSTMLVSTPVVSFSSEVISRTP